VRYFGEVVFGGLPSKVGQSRKFPNRLNVAVCAGWTN
jgi:hypothetical protein